jgi:hypothetical protein
LRFVKPLFQPGDSLFQILRPAFPSEQRLQPFIRAGQAAENDSRHADAQRPFDQVIRIHIFYELIKNYLKPHAGMRGTVVA